MKTIKTNLVSLALILLTVVSCAQNKNKDFDNAPTPVKPKEASLEMNKDSLDLKIIANLEKQIAERKMKLTEEALSTVGETHSLLDEIKKGKKEDAIKKGEILIGKLEVLLTRDPNLSLIPINVNYQKNELITTIEEVRAASKLAQNAMNDGYYQLASDILDDIKSELIINTYLLPTATFPEAIKVAVALLKEDKPKEAELVLNNVLGTIVIQKTIEPLPILNAEQMIIEAALIDKKDHENVAKVLNLLSNADYQLTLAEEMGYGKKDKDFLALEKSIKALKKSVENKENSESKFDSLKKDIIKIKEKIFKKDKK